MSTMNPSDPKSNDSTSVAGVGETTTVDLADVQLTLENAKRGGPPPLPPEVAAPSSSPSVPPPASMGSATPSMAPAAPARSNTFYVVIVLVVLAVGVGAGAVVAMSARKPAETQAAPAASQGKAAAPGVITIPTVEVVDGPDAGP